MIFADGPNVVRGARSYADVDGVFRDLLEKGAVESRTHVEQMSLDMGRLLISVFPSLAKQASLVRQPRFLSRMRSAAIVLWESLGDEAIETAAQSRSDTVRGWAAFIVGYVPRFTLSERLELIRPFACDPHFAVREWAWLSIRPAVASSAREAIEKLRPWVLDSTDFIRRF